MNVRAFVTFVVFLGLGVFLRPARADIGGEPSHVHALTGITIVTEPGTEPLSGTLIVRDGRIEMLGAGVDIPPDAVVHDLPGRTVYPGLIEAYLRIPEAKAEEAETEGATEKGEADRRGTGHPNPRVRPEVRAADLLPLDGDLRREMREAGFTTALVAPARGVFRGTGAIVSLGDGDPADRILVPDHAQVFAPEHGSWGDREYPNSLMGAIALARQTLYDTGWHRDAWSAWSRNGDSVERPAENLSLRALRPVLDREMPLFLESESVEMLPRVLRIAREFRIRPVVVSGGSDEYRRIDRVRDWLADAGASVVLSVAFPRASSWEDDDEAVAIELDELVHWERAPTNPRVLQNAGIPFAVTTQGLEKREQLWERLRAAIRLGLSEETALAALTTVPARLLGIEARTGTLAPGKDANFLVATGPLFDPTTRVEEVWIDGVRYGEDPKRATEADIQGTWDLVIGEGDGAREVRCRFRRTDEGLAGKVVEREDEETGDGDEGAGGEAGDEGARGEARPLENVELVRGILTFGLEGDAFRLRLDGALLRGTAQRPGESKRVLGQKVPKTPKEPKDLWVIHSESAPAWPPEYDPEQAPPVVHLMNATLWTCGPRGILENADLLVVNGRIEAVGSGLRVPRGALVLDASGKHVTPGLIDCHSHSSISGGVNEATNSCTSEVRIADVVNARSRAIYRELAGGLTVSNLLHGSANVIGGQNAVIKLRWGQPAEDLLFAEAPSGIKFALGENVKQSNWGDDYKTRYPQTRMGVEQFLRERLHAAVDYRREWDEWRKRKKGSPPRRDLQLDALLEVLEGDRLVHCHSYRSDEIIMLIRVAEDFGFRIGVFQHVLEGYKAANEIALHGAGASSFSDWWSYKFEVIDAIPYSGEIMWRRGVNVSFNSDSWELSRRLNLEAAKAVKYGGVPEEEALNFVTRNPAMQLGVDEWVGELAPGRHADFVIWSGHPLSDSTVCEETWIDGVMRFSREKDRMARAGALELREKLLAKVAAWNRMQGLHARRGQGGEGPVHGALGRRWGLTEQEAGWHLPRGLCVAEAEED